ncbi:OLC1v1001033C1 [Oldenlandia corymbosa var. corymbosa]|uniref:OLC1v1001033C1 n=1 Tax=Oldenlandia corymbosa var. corymbosa TaxID=529605 RepID=A0AAV1D5H6_OLDCO|nr:OLC1v1001033C1 [Oldenlandia corymbosa var. corymbosa]
MSEVTPPTEEVVKALLDYLVDPMLPLKVSRKNPPLSDQKSVAKQMHAVVLLYNYYQRKQHKESRFLEYEPFCQLVLNLKPALASHMNFAHQGETTTSKGLGNQLSLTEQAIMDACSISMSLETLGDAENVEEWPIRKVSVLLIDSKKENCLLLYDSITNGVWSVIEEFLNVSDIDSEFSMREGGRTSTHKYDAKDSGFEQVAFSAVEKATGILQSELMVLERHVVYSLSKDKTASCFYIMQCIQSSQDFEIPIKDTIESLQGPLLRWSSGCWTQTQVVEYYNVLPYAKVMSRWCSREFIPNGLASLDVSSLEKFYENRSEEFAESRQAISNASQNYCTGLEDIVDKRSLMLESTCYQEFSMFPVFCDRSYNDAKSSGTEAIADEISKLVEKEAEDIEISSVSLAEESSQKVKKEAREMISSDQSFGVTHPALEMVVNSIDAQRSAKESNGTDDFKLEAMESEVNNNAVTRPEGQMSEDCNNVPCTGKDKLNSDNFQMVDMEIVKTEKLENSSDITPPNAGQLSIGACYEVEIDTVECNLGEKVEGTEISKKFVINHSMESKENANAGKPFKITQLEGRESINCKDAQCISKENIVSGNDEIVVIETKNSEKSDNSLDAGHPNARQLEIGVYCSLNSDPVECNRGETEVESTENSKKLLDSNHSMESEENNNVGKSVEIAQPEGQLSENSNNVPCTSGRKTDSENFEMVEIEIERIEKSDNFLDIPHPNSEQLQDGVCCEIKTDTFQCYRGENEVEITENTNKVLDINHSAVELLESDLFLHIGEGTICTDNSTQTELEVEDINRSETCLKITHSSFEELGNTVNGNSWGKETSGDNSEKTQRLVIETEKSDRHCDDVKCQGLSSNTLEDSKQCPSPNLQAIQYAPRKRQKMQKNELMDFLNRHKDQNLEVPNRFYHHRKRKPALESGSSSSVAGTSIDVDTAGTPKSLSCNFRKENVAENSINAADCGIISTIAEKDLELTQTALNVLFSKRTKLCLQKRMIQDEVVHCDQNIQKILEGTVPKLNHDSRFLMQCVIAFISRNKTMWKLRK